ncbi:MAG: hypothetical protein AAF355_12085 [Myxococcota bacterium]
MVLWCMSTTQSVQTPWRTWSVRTAHSQPDLVRLAIRFIAFPPADVDRSWLDEQLDWANRLFKPAQTVFTIGEVRTGDQGYADVRTRNDRHRFGSLVHAGSIHCFLVRALEDVDVPGRFIQGVHWRRRRPPQSHYILLSEIAAPTVLAHELGHFFGNHRHSEVPGNIMSYRSADGDPFFDRAQIGVIQRHVSRFLLTGELQNIRSISE